MKGKPLSLRDRMLRYFAEHPGAELTRRQIIERFCVGEKHVDKTLWEMRADGVVETVHVTRKR